MLETNILRYLFTYALTNNNYILVKNYNDIFSRRTLLLFTLPSSSSLSPHPPSFYIDVNLFIFDKLLPSSSPFLAFLHY